MRVPAKYTLLIVDDEPDVCDSVHDFAPSGVPRPEGPQRAGGISLDAGGGSHIIMTDQRMPQVSGVELLTRVKAKNPQAVRMLFTGYADLESIIAAITRGTSTSSSRSPGSPRSCSTRSARPPWNTNG